MGAFAVYLKRKGIEITGSDQNVYPPMSDVLKNGGVETFNGYRAENITSMSKKPDLVIIGNVISANNPEARAAIDGGYKYTSLPEAMQNFLLQDTTNLVVAGTHGKTTTSSMLAHTLVKCKKDPCYFIGGVSQDLPFSFQVSNTSRGNYFVLEGDEYDTAFWDKVPKFNHYLPDHAILTSIEYDHADIYPDLAAVVRAFEGLLSRIRPGGHLIACYDFEEVKNICKNAKVQLITYGATPETGATFTPGKVRVDQDVTRFEILENKKPVTELTIQLPGQHNVMNAIAVWLECRKIGISDAEIIAGLKSFRGVKRRQEVRGEVRGITVIDDFAHHPTAVRETLRALKLKYSGHRMIAVFEPRSATSRRKVFQKDYADAFAEADLTFISSPYDQSRILVQDQFSSDELVGDLLKGGRKAELMVSIESGITQVVHQAQSGDVIAVLSNGGFGGFVSKLLDALKS